MCLNTLSAITNRKHSIRIDMESLFHSHLIQLPRIVYAGDADDQLGALLFMAKSNFKVILSCREAMERFIIVLISACELDRSIALLHAEHSNRIVHAAAGACPTTPWKELKMLVTQNL
jgi:hypothetical protein